MFDDIEDIIDDVPNEELYKEACIRSSFSQYSDRLRRIPKLTEDARRCLLEQGATRELWIDSLRLVLYVYHQLKKIGYFAYIPAGELDLVQVGNLAALEAISRWNPDKGMFSTFLVPRIRGAMIDYASEQARWSALTKSTPITQENASDDDYGDWDAAPFDPEDAWNSPTEAIQDGAQNDTQKEDASYEAALNTQLGAAIALLEDKLHNDLVMRYYQDNSIDRIAKVNGVSRQTIHNRIKEAIKILRSILVTNCDE